MSRTLDMAKKAGILGENFQNAPIRLTRGDVHWETPYTYDDFMDYVRLDGQDRLIWCCLTELGPRVAGYEAENLRSGGPPRPTKTYVGRYTLPDYVRGLESVLGPLDPWLEAMEADLGMTDGDLEWQWMVAKSSRDTASLEFQLGLMPESMAWDELYRSFLVKPTSSAYEYKAEESSGGVLDKP